MIIISINHSSFINQASREEVNELLSLFLSSFKFDWMVIYLTDCLCEAMFCLSVLFLWNNAISHITG